MKALRSTLRAGCAVMGLLLVWKAIHLQGRASELRAVTAELDWAMKQPVIVVGSPITEAAGELYVLEASTESASQATDGVRQRLVLVRGAASAQSAADLGPWTELIARVRWRPGQALWVVCDRLSPASTALFETARSRGVEARLLRMRSPEAFMSRTGLSGVPSALLFRGNRLQSMSIGALTREEVATFASHLGETDGSFRANPLFVDRRPDPIATIEHGGPASIL